MNVRSVRLSDRQLAVRNAIEAYAKDHGGDCPSYRELADLVGLKSISGIARHVTALERKGAISRNQNIPRSLVVLDPMAITVVLPRYLDVEVRRLAKQHDVTPEQIVTEMVRDGCSPMLPAKVSRETSKSLCAPSAATG